MATKTPSLRQLAEKQIRRLERATRRAVERGYVFDLPFRRTKTGTEKTRYTRKEVEELSRLHLKDLYKYSKYGNETFGYVSGEEYRKEEAKWQAKHAASARWEKEKERIRKQEELERKRLLSDISSKQQYVSISKTVIDNCMDRKNWRYTDKYYERFKELVERKIAELSYDAVANIFQRMLSEGVLTQIQRHYKPEDFFIDFAAFQEYFDKEMEVDNTDDAIIEDNDEFEDYEGDDFEEIFG